MRTGHPIETTSRGRLARGLLVVLALALVMTIAAAGAALALDSRPAGQHGPAPAPAHSRTAGVDETASQDSSSPMVPLVFAGILILAVASPALPRHYSRYGHYRGERW